MPAVAVVPLVQTRTLARPLDYLAEPALPVGAVVDAPLGPRTVRGVVVGPAEGGDRALKKVRDTGLRIPADLVELALEIAARYASTPARALELVLPPTTAPRRTFWAALDQPGEPRGTRQAAVLAALADGPLPLPALRAATGAGADVLRRLQARGLIIVSEAVPAPAVTGSGPQLTPAQAVAVERLERAVEERDPAPLLLFGVTGSGKTEVFLRGIERCLALGRSAIVLVPEIALAPQTAGRVSARFGPRVAVLHSALAAGERAAEYARIVRGEATIVIGPRSALFAPVADLGLIVIDEEHEAAYKQDSDPRYDARAIAILRARRHGAAVLLATATPRPEAWRPLERIELPGRIGGRLPPVDIVDLRRDGAYPDLATAARGAGRDRRRGRARRPAAEPPRRGAGAALPVVRRHVRLPRLRRRVHAAPAARPRCCATTAAGGSGSRAPARRAPRSTSPASAPVRSGWRS